MVEIDVMNEMKVVNDMNVMNEMIRTINIIISNKSRFRQPHKESKIRILQKAREGVLKQVQVANLQTLTHSVISDQYQLPMISSYGGQPFSPYDVETRSDNVQNIIERIGKSREESQDLDDEIKARFECMYNYVNMALKGRWFSIVQAPYWGNYKVSAFLSHDVSGRRGNQFQLTPLI